MSGDCTIVAAGAITCTKTGGVAFGPFASATGTGIPSQTGSTINFRTITGTTNQITATNGDGTSGNPTLSFPTADFISVSPALAAASSTVAKFKNTTAANNTAVEIDSVANQNAGVVLDNNTAIKWVIRNTGSDTTNRYSILNAAVASEVFSILQAGDVGVGTTTPSSPSGFTKALELSHASSASFVVTGGANRAEFGVSASGGYIGSAGSLPFRLGAAGVEKARIDASGNFGFGTTTPIVNANTSIFATLSGDALGANKFGEFSIGGNITGTSNPVGNLNFYNSALGTADKRIATIAASNNGATNSGVLDFYTYNAGTPASAMTIDKSRNVGIGTSTPSAQLHTTSTVRFAGLSGVGTSGCLGNDTSGNITAGNPCTGTGFPSGGVKGDIAYYSAASTGAATKASDANIIIQGGDPSGGSTSTAAAVLAYGYSKRIVLPPASGGATGVYKFSTDVIFPTGTELNIPCGVTLKPDSGKVVRNIGVTKGGQCQIADTSAGGTVYLGRDVKAEWWPSTGGDSALAINAADASTTDAVTNNADGGETIIRLACNKTYTPLTSITLHAKLGNDQKLVGCGPSTVFDPTGGSFSTGGMLTQIGATGSDSLMAFTWSDFTVTCSADQNLEALTLAGSGGGSNSIRSNTKNRIARLRITGCRTGIGFYNTRNVVVEDVQIQVRGDTTFDSRTMYFGGAAFVGDTDIVRGQYECSPGPTPTGGVGYGMRFDSTAGTNISGIRVNGTVFYNCNKMINATWSSTGTMGDHWFYGGTQCETCSNIADYGGSAAGINAAMIRFNDLYFTNSQDTQYTATISDGAGGSGNQMAISAVVSGLPDYNTKLRVGFSVRGAGVTAGTIVSALGTCTMVPLAPCTATVSNNHTILGGTAMVSNDSQPKFRFDGGNADEIVDVSINKVRIRGGGGCTSCRIASFAGTSLINITDNQFASVNGSGSMPVEIFSFVSSRKATIIGNTIDPFGISGAPDHLVSASSSSNDIVITGNNVRGGASDIANFSGVTNSCVSLNLPNSNVSC
jgi:Fe-S cluster biogenesis protein NfuA